MPAQQSISRVLFTLGGLALAVAVWSAWSLALQRSRVLHRERWFAPGPWGHEAGRSAPAPGAVAFLTRHIGGLGSPDAAAWARHNRLTPSLDFSHNLANVFPPGLFASHPEYFPWVNGQRYQPAVGSGSWNPDLGRDDVALRAAEVARVAFESEPERVSYALGVNDGLVFGESPETLAVVMPQRWFRGRPDYSNLVFGFMNRAATALARSHPDKYLGALAYYWAENVPDFPVHPQVVPFLTADRSQGYDSAFWREEFALQERWAKAGPKRLGLYDYLDGYGFAIPRIHPHLIAQSLAHARKLGFTDYYGEASPNWGIDGPMTWLVAQLLSDPNQNVDGLLDEYYERYFQESAAPMRRFFQRCEERWLGQAGPSYWMKHYRNESQAGLFPATVCAELRQLLDEARRLARRGKVQARVAFVADSFGVTERLVRMKEARDRLHCETVTGKLAGPGGVQLLGALLEAKSDFVRYSKELTARLPLAFAPIAYDDLLRNAPELAATAVLVGEATGSPAAETNQVLAGLRNCPETSVADGVAFARVVAQGGATEILSDGGLEGPRRPGKRIAGLPYGIDLPGAWHSKVEPTQTHVGELTKSAAHSGEAGLRIAGAVNTSVYQWLPAKAGHLYVASVRARGHVGPSDMAFLTFSWADAQGRRIGPSAGVRLPDGEWPDWVQLRYGGRAPKNATWVGIGIQVQNQLTGDWAEFDDFSMLDAGVAK